ncbi:MAG: hypothetical protein GX376_06555, partial [Firmicutes bacterium]|nr:hypothetical protein [Bacillota bacterium]
HVMPELIEIAICRDSGLLAKEECPRVRRMFVIKGTEPQEYCDIHGSRAPGYNYHQDDNEENSDDNWNDHYYPNSQEQNNTIHPKP